MNYGMKKDLSDNFITSALLFMLFLLGILDIIEIRNIFHVCKDRLHSQQENLLSDFDDIYSIIQKSIERLNAGDLTFLSLLLHKISEMRMLKDQIDKKLTKMNEEKGNNIIILRGGAKKKKGKNRWRGGRKKNRNG